MKQEIGKVGPIGREILDSAVRAVNATHRRQSFIEKAKRLSQYRQDLAANTDCQQLRSRVLAAAGIDQCELERCTKHEAKEMRAFLEREERAIVDQSGVIAQQHNQLARQRPKMLTHLGAFANSAYLITLDVADRIDLPWGNERGEGFERDARSDPPASMHNFVKAYQRIDRQEEYGNRFCFPVDIPFFADFYFHWRTDVDVELNVLTFVQLNGKRYQGLDWSAFGGSGICVKYRSSLKYFIPPPNFDPDHNSEGYLISNLDSTSSQLSDQTDLCTADIGWADFQGVVDHGPINDDVELFDNSHFRLPAGYAIIFVVRVDCRIVIPSCHAGNSIQELDFRSGDFGINVPAVFLGVSLVPSSSSGVIYGVKNDGTLYWYKHLGFADGSDSWVNGGLPKAVGSGDQIFRLMFSGGHGVIYGVKNDGTLNSVQALRVRRWQ